MATVDHLRRILERHRGRAQAIRVKTLAELLDTDERRVRLLKRELAETMLIGSSCDTNHPGYFLPESQEEIDATLGNYRARITALFALIKATQGAAGVNRAIAQLRLEFGAQAGTDGN